MRRPLTAYLVGYLILALAIAGGFYLIRREAHTRQAFDDRRAYELCLGANEARESIKEAIRRQADVLISVSAANRTPAPNPAAEQAYRRSIAEYRAKTAESLEPLKPRKCELLPQNSAGPQR